MLLPLHGVHPGCCWGPGPTPLLALGPLALILAPTLLLVPLLTILALLLLLLSPLLLLGKASLGRCWRLCLSLALETGGPGLVAWHGPLLLGHGSSISLAPTLELLGLARIAAILTIVHSLKMIAVRKGEKRNMKG